MQCAVSASRLGARGTAAAARCVSASVCGASAPARGSHSLLARPASLPASDRHHSNAEALISAAPVIEVLANVAMCDGGGGAMGHPIEFIKLELRDGAKGVACRYCGLRYRKAAGHHAH